MRLMPAKAAGCPVRISWVPLFPSELTPTWAGLGDMSQRVLAGMEIGLWPRGQGCLMLLVGTAGAAPDEEEDKVAGESPERGDSLPLLSSITPDMLCC